MIEKPSLRVTAVRRIKLEEPVPVYDATVPVYHNFELHNGVVVHNTAKKARDTGFQEVMRLQGKPANALRMPLSKLLMSGPVRNILAALGYQHEAADKYAALRVGRIYLLADADPDGMHINALILTILYKLLPKLFEQGRVFVCDAPLYSAFFKGRYYFGATYDECFKQMPKGCPKGLIVRAKGWGELQPEMLNVIAFRPDTRNIIKLLPIKGKEEQYFNRILGGDASSRRELLGL